jgi:hypothetical protein
VTEFAPAAKDSLVIVLIFLIAVAQALTILLTIRRERDVKELRELVEEQRLRLVELRAWLSGRNASQQRLPKSERETVGEPIANNAKVSESPKEAIQSRTAEEEAAQAMKVINWQREIIAGLRAGLKRDAPPEPGITRAPEPAITPKDSPDALRPGTTENELERTTKAINSLKEEAEKTRKRHQLAWHP